MQNQDVNTPGNAPESHERRNAIKKISAGVGVVVGCSVLPDKWIRPVVARIALPAHAATSGPVVSEVVSQDATSSSQDATTQQTGDYNTTETFNLRSFEGNNKRFTWLPQTGAYYGGQVKFEYSNGCGELIVPNAAASHGADGSTSNHDQAFYFCGTDFAPGEAEYNAGRASVFAAPNCPAATVTIHYNK